MNEQEVAWLSRTSPLMDLEILELMGMLTEPKEVNFWPSETCATFKAFDSWLIFCVQE